MKKRYFVWKDASCNGINPQWIELTGKEFYEFRKKPENKNRLFSTLGDPDYDDECFIMESTPEQFRKANSDYCKRYRRIAHRIESGRTEVSFYSSVSELTTLTYEDVISAEEDDIEEKVIEMLEKEALYRAIETLSPEERKVILAYFLSNENNKGEREIARAIGIPRKTLNNRKLAAIKKLSDFLAQN